MPADTAGEVNGSFCTTLPLTAGCAAEKGFVDTTELAVDCSQKSASDTLLLTVGGWAGAAHGLVCFIGCATGMLGCVAEKQKKHYVNRY